MPMKEYNEKLNLGKGSAFVKSRLSRLPRTDEVWKLISNRSRCGDGTHGSRLEPWRGMVLTQTENFHLALLASEALLGINDLASLLAKVMEHPWVMGKRRPTRIVLRNNPQWEELIPHLKQLKIEVITQQELPLWDDAAAAYVQRLRASRSRSRSPDHHGSAGTRRGVPRLCPAGSIPRDGSRSASKRGRDSWSVLWIMEKGEWSSMICIPRISTTDWSLLSEGLKVGTHDPND